MNATVKKNVITEGRRGPKAPGQQQGMFRQDDLITIQGIDYRTFRFHFTSSRLAEHEGYLPKSRWIRVGRNVLPVERPILCVAKSWMTFRPEDSDIILAYSQLNKYLVTNPRYFDDIQSLGCWPVFCEAETCPRTNVKQGETSREYRRRNDSPSPELLSFAVSPKTNEAKRRRSFQNQESQRKQNANHKSSLLSPSSYYSSHDGERPAKSHCKPRSRKDLCSEQNHSRLITPAGPKRCCQKFSVYFPEDFPWDRYAELEQFRSSVLWFAHKLHERRFVNADGHIYSCDDFISIKSAHAREIDPNFRHAIKLMLDLGLVERDYYEPDRKSYGYRFTDPELRRARRKRIPLDDSRLAKRIQHNRKKLATTRTDRWL